MRRRRRKFWVFEGVQREMKHELVRRRREKNLGFWCCTEAEFAADGPKIIQICSNPPNLSSTLENPPLVKSRSEHKGGVFGSEHR